MFKQKIPKGIKVLFLA